MNERMARPPASHTKLVEELRVTSAMVTNWFLLGTVQEK